MPDGADTAIGAAINTWGGIDVLVDNAGWSVPGFIATDTDRDKWQRTIEINLFSARRPWWPWHAPPHANTAGTASDPMWSAPGW